MWKHLFLFLFSLTLAFGCDYDNGDVNYCSYHGSDTTWDVGVTSYAYTNVQATLTSLFVDSIGINIHGIGSGAYDTFRAKIFQNLLDSGIRHLRVQSSPTDYPIPQSTIVQLGQMGFKMTMLCDGTDPLGMAALIKKINAQFTSQGLEPVIIAAEGPNEPDNFWKVCCNRNSPVFYDGQTFPEGPRLFLQDLYNALKSDPATNFVKVVGIATGLNNTYANQSIDLSGIVDWGNFHPYPYGGASWSYNFSYLNINYYYSNANFPSVNLDEYNHDLTWSQIPYPNRPMMATESGYMSVGPSVPFPLAPYVTYDVQAKYTPRIYAEYFRLGLKRLLLYEACDEFPVTSQNYTTVELFGIMDGYATPKPAFYALKSLLDLLGNDLPSYPEANNDAYIAQLNANNVILSYTSDIQMVTYPDSTAECEELYGPHCNQYYRTYFIHHLLLQRPSTNDLFLLVWHDISATDRNYVPPKILSHPPIPVTFTFTSGKGLDVANLASTLQSATIHTYDANYNFQAANLQFVANNKFVVNVLDTISVVQLTMTPPTPPPTPSPPIPSASPQYQGCFYDSGARDLTGLMYYDQALTPSTCSEWCGVRGYRYAGLQNADECWCGNSYGAYGQAPDSDCNMGCTGDWSIRCGSGWRNSIYKTNFLGCYVDTGARDFSDMVSQSDTTTTVEGCVALCAEFSYAGLQDANQCWCSDTYGTFGVGSDSDCNMPCTGNPQEMCGGVWRNSVFAV